MKLQRRTFLRLAAGVAALPAIPHIARAQAYPTRPVRLIVPYPAGGGADTIARLEVGSHPFLIEAVEEPTSIAGVTSPELNFVGIEPWLVFLVDLEGGVRWIIAVSSAGQVVGQMRIPLQELEASHYPVEG